MTAKRIISCLDIKEGRVVKGVQFTDLKDAGDPLELAGYYSREGADELVFLDITASHQRRETTLELVRRTAQRVSIPFIVGGGISSIEQIRAILNAGADKVSLGSAAVEKPALIGEAARVFGRHCVVVAVDARWSEQMGDWEVYTHGGRNNTGISALSWAARIENLGAGEILLTSMDADGGGDGFDLPLTRAVREQVGIPVIASGGAGQMTDFVRVLTEGKADAALAASVFHYRRLSIPRLKEFLREQGVEVHS